MEKKKVAVISSYACIVNYNNYGALLQYYALQTYLKKNGIFAYWIRYVLEDENTFTYKLKKQIKQIVHPKYYLFNILCSHYFKQFIIQNLNVSKKKYVGDYYIKKMPPKADYYVTGSDQVWAGTLRANYLHFVKDDTKKIAYAVSFGANQITQEHKSIIKPWVSKFEHISVREVTGISICDSIGKKAIQLLDPTLLIDRVDYPFSTNMSTDVFCYFTNIKNVLEIHLLEIKAFCREQNLKFKIASIQGNEFYFSLKDLVFPSPEEWLGYYNSAKYIITNTFHGTVFAIIFKKPFITILQKGISKEQNCRIISLLNMFGLQERIYKVEESIDSQLIRPINWSLVDKSISEYRILSDIFFKESIL